VGREIVRARIVQCGMIYRLQPHVDSACPPISGIKAEICPAIVPAQTSQAQTSQSQPSQLLTIRYIIAGRIADLAVPTRSLSQRTDELWQHTCCEAFFGAADREAYWEFNFSPSTQWAAYRFSKYRHAMQIADAVIPNVDVLQSTDKLEVMATVDLAQLPIDRIAMGESMRIGLSAIVEERGGRKSYWALAHAPGKPDFHHALSFVTLRL
jgi:hypothetical protein